MTRPAKETAKADSPRKVYKKATRYILDVTQTKLIVVSCYNPLQL